jgi:hypothetical protein
MNDIDFHLTYSSIPNTSSDVSRDIEPYWEHDKFNNEKMKWKIVYRDEQLVKTTSARLAFLMDRRYFLRLCNWNYQT